MPPPIPRCSSWAYSSLISPSCFSLPRYGSRVGLHIVLFEACSTFTRVAACTLALSPIRDTLIEGVSHFVTSMTAPIASGWSGCRVGLAPTRKRRLCTAHTKGGHRKRHRGGASHGMDLADRQAWPEILDRGSPGRNRRQRSVLVGAGHEWNGCRHDQAFGKAFRDTGSPTGGER